MKYFPLKMLLVLVLSGLTVSCSDDWDDNPQSASVNDFIWKGLNQYYYWLTDSPDLSDDRFASQTEYTQFLETFATPENVFDHLKLEAPQTALVFFIRIIHY
ncbi:hypothetical protein [Flavobacterium sediminis]|nr:hypothetical protein [Flavobacterium sediminis]